MATFKQHCAEALQTYGQPFAEVHLWLDEFAGKPPYGMRHRKKRHHLAGIEEVRQLCGCRPPTHSHRLETGRLE